MERAIDRTSYRRSNRISNEEKSTPVSRNLSLKAVFNNEIIIAMSILAGTLLVKLLDLKSAEDWIESKINAGIPFETLADKATMQYAQWQEEFAALFQSGERIEEENSGEILEDRNGSEPLMKESGEENPQENQEDTVEKENTRIYESAVEGVNQLSEDAKMVKENYHLIRPVNGTVTSVFGARTDTNPIVSAYHTGLDIAANTGTTIVAAHHGEVTYAGVLGGYGNCIMITDGKLTTLYGHCSKISIKKGDEVKQGEKIGEVGMTGNATGPHVHFEIKYEERYVNPEDVV